MAALRLGMYEILFADATPDYAAVDQADKRCRAVPTAGFVGAISGGRRERDQVTARLADDSTMSGRGGAFGPDWLVKATGRVGRERARELRAATICRPAAACRARTPCAPTR